MVPSKDDFSGKCPDCMPTELTEGSFVCSVSNVAVLFFEICENLLDGDFSNDQVLLNFICEVCSVYVLYITYRSSRREGITPL
jgi:hypothetical protein